MEEQRKMGLIYQAEGRRNRKSHDYNRDKQAALEIYACMSEHCERVEEKAI